MKVLKQLVLFVFFLLLASCEKWELDADCSEGIPEAIFQRTQENILTFRIDDFVANWQILEEETEAILKTFEGDSIVIDKKITPNGNFIVKANIETTCGLSKELISHFSNQESWFPNMVEFGNNNCGSILGNPSYSYNIYVQFRRFSISEKEITNEVYHEVMGGKDYSDCPQCPKIVFFIDAVQFCNRLSYYAGKEQVYFFKRDPRDLINFKLSDIIIDASANGYRIPTRMEWEKAAIGGCPEPYFESHFFGLINSVKYGNLSLLETKTKTEPVGSYEPKFGLYDMMGNAGEWISEDENGLFTSEIKKQADSLRRNWQDFRLIAGGDFTTTSPKFNFRPDSSDNTYKIKLGYFVPNTGIRVVHY